MLAVVTTVIMLALIGLSFYKSPVAMGIGVALFLAGIPMYGLVILCRNSRTSNTCMGKSKYIPACKIFISGSNLPILICKTVYTFC